MCEDRSLRVASTFQSGKSKDENFSKWHRQRHTTKLSRTNSIYGRTARKWLYISSGILQFKRVRMSVEVYELKPTHAVGKSSTMRSTSLSAFASALKVWSIVLVGYPQTSPKWICRHLLPVHNNASYLKHVETLFWFVLICSNGLCWGHPANDKHEHCNWWAYPIVEKMSPDGSDNRCHMAELTALYGMPRESVHGMPHGLPEHIMRTLAFCGTCRMLHPDWAMVRM